MKGGETRPTPNTKYPLCGRQDDKQGRFSFFSAVGAFNNLRPYTLNPTGMELLCSSVGAGMVAHRPSSWLLSAEKSTLTLC